MSSSHCFALLHWRGSFRFLTRSPNPRWLLGRWLNKTKLWRIDEVLELWMSLFMMNLWIKYIVVLVWDMDFLHFCNFCNFFLWYVVFLYQIAKTFGLFFSSIWMHNNTEKTNFQSGLRGWREKQKVLGVKSYLFVLHRWLRFSIIDNHSLN